MALVSNQWVAEYRDKLFANTASYNTEIPMAGRKEPTEQLRRLLTNKDGLNCAVISDLLGAGKTFFLTHARIDLVRTRQIDEERQIVTLFTDQVGKGRVPDDAARAKVLIIEELDRKKRHGYLLGALEAVVQWLHEDKKAILTGDYWLKAPEALKVLEDLRVEHIPLEPLTKDLLLEAVELRLGHWLQSLGLVQGSKKAKKEASKVVQEMFDPKLLQVLVPRTDPPVATFREVLGLIKDLALSLPLDHEPCRFTVDTFREWDATYRRGRLWSDEQRFFVEALYQVIRDRAGDGSFWRPLDIDEWLEIIPEAEEFEDDLESEIIAPLARTGALVPMGIPYSDPAREKDFRPPYLPSVRTFAQALLS
ncbi:MAG TPA: hypothetical protein VF952_00685 [Chloroflexia bacterium]|jgi:hypothetical protein